MNLVYVLLLICAQWVVLCLIGGTRLVFSLPGYGILATAALLSLFSLRRTKPTPNLACLVVSTGFFGYILARAANSPVPYLGWTDFYMVIGCLLAYLLTSLYITSTRDRMIIVVALLALALMEVLFGLRQFRGGDDWMPFGLFRTPTGSRASGTLVSSIHLAGYLEAVGVFALALAFWSKWAGWARILAGYVGLFCYVGVAITGSRGGYLSSVFALFVFTCLSLWVLRKARPARFLPTLLIVAVIAFIGLSGAFVVMSKSPLLKQRLELLTQSNKDVRVYNWQATLDQFRVEPIWGTGAGTHLYYGRYFRRPQIQADPVHAHSDYLEILAEYGLIGGIGMAAFILFHLHSGWSSFSRITREELANTLSYEPLRDNALALDLGAISAVASYLAHSVVDFNLHIPGNALLFAFIFGILATPGRTVASLSRAKVLPFQLALPALGVWMCFSGLPKFPAERLTSRMRLAFHQQRYPDAIRAGTEALEMERRNPFVHFFVGESHRALATTTLRGEPRRAALEAAVTNFRAALALFPQDANVWLRLGQALDDLARFSEARLAYSRAVELDPKLGVVRAMYAAHLAKVGRLDEAKDQLLIAQRFGVGKAANAIQATSLPAYLDEASVQ
ncbi:MAG TPA: O-antigen ligase family protein [Chthoniobacteraceae bacterium]|nr:O-antigen ligase family protein [Chthoniobacteraceae bacterium]